MQNYKEVCFDCFYYDDEFDFCKKGLNPHKPCKGFEEIRYQLTPKGFLSVLLQEHVTNEDFEIIWEEFSDFMDNNYSVEQPRKVKVRISENTRRHRLKRRSHMQKER